MLALLVEFHIAPARAEAFAAEIAANAKASRETEPGCRQFDVCRDPQDPCVFFLYELYDDVAAIQSHLRSDHFIAMDRRTRGWVVAKTVRQLRRTSP